MTTDYNNSSSAGDQITKYQWFPQLPNESELEGKAIKISESSQRTSERLPVMPECHQLLCTADISKVLFLWRINFKK